jgi:hypothetical protein
MAALARSLSAFLLRIPNTFFQVFPLLLPMAGVGQVSASANTSERRLSAAVW